MPQPVAIFCAAAPQDTSWLIQWEKHLFPLQKAGQITIWSERHLLPGANRRDQMAFYFGQAALIVFLLSADFFVDDECNELVTQAQQRLHHNQASVIPLLVRSVTWRDTDLGALSCLPANGRPVSRWGDRDEAFKDCVTSIKRLLAQVTSAQAVNQHQQQASFAQLAPGSATAYHSCFIAYAHDDEPLGLRLHNDLQAQGVNCWIASQDLKIGAKIRSSIDRAIHQHDKLLLLLSQHSIKSTWIEDEVEAALEYERRENREMLFPLDLDNSFLHSSYTWAARLRRTTHIGDLTNWTDPQAYQQAFDRLLHDLKKS